MNLNNFMPKFMKVVNVVGNAIMLNICFLITCLPVVTIGPAWCGLLSAIRYEIRGDKWFDGFKVGVKTRFLRNFITGIVGTAALIYFANNAQAGVVAFMSGAGGLASTVITCAMLLGTAMVMLCLLITSVYFDANVEHWTEYAFMLLQKAPLQVAILAVLMWLPVLLFMQYILFFLEILIAFIALYFILTGLVMTALLKNGLLKVLARHKELYPAQSTSEE